MAIVTPDPAGEHRCRDDAPVTPARSERAVRLMEAGAAVLQAVATVVSVVVTFPWW